MLRSMELSLECHRIDHHAYVVDGDQPLVRDPPGFGIDLNLANHGAIGIAGRSRIDAGPAEPGAEGLGKPAALGSIVFAAARG